jgi:endopolyphosphatase
VYKLQDLSVRSYLELARRIAESTKGSANAAFEDAAGDLQADKKKEHDKKKKEEKKNKVWFAFIRRAFVGTMDVGDIEDQFGQQGGLFL